MNDRELEQKDHQLLEDSLEADEFHKGVTLDAFTKEGIVSRIVEDGSGPIAAYRLSKVLRLDTQFFDNGDIQRNRQAIFNSIPEVLAVARANGFQEVIFQSDNNLLKKFMRKHFQFEESDGEMKRII